ncbi:MAG: (Na+)-NQR maturation NqrM [Pseudohongiellaceae bacterium]
MLTVIASLIVLTCIVALMSIGVIMGRKPVQGTCGGLNNLEGMGECDLCGGSRKKCENINTRN